MKHSFLFLALGLTLASRGFADDNVLPHKFEFGEGHKHYYLRAVLDPLDQTQLKGFQVFDHHDRPTQFIDYDEDLSNKVPGFIRGELPGTSPVRFEDCNFDGYVDLMLRDEAAGPHHAAFDIYLWNQKKRQFIPFDEDGGADLEINSVDPKTKTLQGGGSYGHGFFSISTYRWNSKGKLEKILDDMIDYSKGTEVKTYYSNGRISKVVNSDAPPQN